LPTVMVPVFALAPVVASIVLDPQIKAAKSRGPQRPNGRGKRAAR
jgi:hypothetical protein